jgi:PKD domain-containing protein
VLALGLGGCDPEFCDSEVPDPIAAILIGLLCSGRDPGPSTPPTASFTAQPSSIPSGGTVRLDASASSDAESAVVRYEWDLDLFPLDFELDTGSRPVTEQQLFLTRLSGPEQRTIRLRVTDRGGNTATTERTVTITSVTFAAAFTVFPGVPFVGNTVTFDGSGSTGARFYSWDLDGDGSFETGPSESPTATHVYATPGERLVRLRIADPIGLTTEAQRAINVRASRAAAARTSAAERRGFAARLTRVRVSDDLPAAKMRGGVTTLRGLAARGRLVAPGRRLGPLKPFRRARWVARLNLRATGDDSRLRGVALARFPRGRGRACLRITMTTRDRGRPAGRVTVLGGSGDAARLRGSGRFRFGFRDGTPRLDGRLRASLGRTRPLPRACAGL